MNTAYRSRVACVHGRPRQQFVAHTKAELVKWAQVIKRSGARID